MNEILLKQAKDLYKAPFKYDGGYVLDVDDNKALNINTACTTETPRFTEGQKVTLNTYEYLLDKHGKNTTEYWSLIQVPGGGYVYGINDDIKTRLGQVVTIGRAWVAHTGVSRYFIKEDYYSSTFEDWMFKGVEDNQTYNDFGQLIVDLLNREFESESEVTP